MADWPSGLRRRFAKPLFPGSNPGSASNSSQGLTFKPILNQGDGVAATESIFSTACCMAVLRLLTQP